MQCIAQDKFAKMNTSVKNKDESVLDSKVSVLPTEEELERKYSYRFSEKDEAFQNHIAKERYEKVPPLIENCRGLTYIYSSSDESEVVVADDIELENFKAMCEVESGIPTQNFIVLFNQTPLTDPKRSIKDYGIKDGDCVILQQTHTEQMSNNLLGQLDFSKIKIPENLLESMMAKFTEGEHQRYRQHFLNNPHELTILKDNNPKLANSLLNDNDETFRKVYEEEIGHLVREEAERKRKIAMDPFSPEAQRLIAEEIKQKNIDANMQSAFEYSPEVFASVTMLYINCKVNGHPIKAFVDSGAQSTIMSIKCAERCQIMRLVDQRFAGIARGIGIKKIFGKIHMAQFQIEKDFLINGLMVIDQEMDCLIGLDMLRRHQCSIDLKYNVLRIGTTGTETRFLSDHEIPTINDDEDILKFKQEHTASTSSSVAETTTSSKSLLSSDNFTEEDIKAITDLKFDRKMAISELRNQNGDRNKAIAALFAKSFKF